jgi:pimeloyl-ACP methyl ester carboxylesterase
MASGGDTDTNLRDERDADASATVLATINRDLQKSVLRPFRDPGSGLRYVRQLIDFWSHDVRNVAARIDIPVLLFASEYDRVATPEASEWASQMFPRARLLQAQGATHYFLYDRADVVARMVEWFISTLEAPQVGVLSCNSATRPGVSATIGDNSPAAS